MFARVVICWKIRIFAYWTTPERNGSPEGLPLWFAEKFVSLLIEQHLSLPRKKWICVVICWKIRIFAYWTTPRGEEHRQGDTLWFAEKFVSLLIEQHLNDGAEQQRARCDLLKNSYLCLLNNTYYHVGWFVLLVVICWKVRIFAYWTTPHKRRNCRGKKLWFAEKFVSLLIEQHRKIVFKGFELSCDLLKNSYLCLLNNTIAM